MGTDHNLESGIVFAGCEADHSLGLCMLHVITCKADHSLGLYVLHIIPVKLIIVWVT